MSRSQESVGIEYRISTRLSDMDIDAVHRYLKDAYWSKNIPIDVLRKAISNSLNFGVFYESEQVGFARVVTDKATFAYLADVYIDQEHRCKGLSGWLMSKVINHPELQGLRRMLLATSDAHGLYEKFGFSPLSKPESMMEVWQPDVYAELN